MRDSTRNPWTLGLGWRPPRLIIEPLFVPTTNRGKLVEIIDMIHEYFPTVKSIHGRAAKSADEIETTYLGNARIKAVALADELEREGHSHFSVLADDSGLGVDLLAGAPGVLSARYAGDHVSPDAHIEKLLRDLSHLSLSLSARTARYHCAIVLIQFENGQRREWAVEGTCEGLITLEPKGESGFGYDPVFYSRSLKETMSEATFEDKNSISHRRDAFKKLYSGLCAV